MIKVKVTHKGVFSSVGITCHLSDKDSKNKFLESGMWGSSVNSDEQYS
jgi:hypothetical protein